MKRFNFIGNIGFHRLFLLGIAVLISGCGLVGPKGLSGSSTSTSMGTSTNNASTSTTTNTAIFTYTNTGSNSGTSISGPIVAVTVGVGGRIVSGIVSDTDGSASMLLDTEAFPQSLQSAIVYNASPNPPTCPATTIPLQEYGGWQCCFAALECLGGGFDSDFYLRGVAYGNGLFVAVGGASTGIAQSSTDGLHWSAKSNYVSGSGLVTGTITDTNWIGGVAYGNGVFVAAGYDGYPLVSTDGVHWNVTATKKTPGVLRSIYFLQDHFFAVGDNGTWGLTVDGSKWDASGTSPVGITSIVRVGDMMYGIVPYGGLYQASAIDGGANWTPINSTTYPSSTLLPTYGFFGLVYNTATQTFLLWNGGEYLTTQNPTGSWTAVGEIMPSPFFFTGQYYVSYQNNTLARSMDAKNWTAFSSSFVSTNAQPLQTSAFGPVNISQ
jgi:hypothetical protein